MFETTNQAIVYDTVLIISYIWLVVYLPLRKIWKSVGIIITNIWENKKCSETPTRQVHDTVLMISYKISNNYGNYI